MYFSIKFRRYSLLIQIKCSCKHEADRLDLKDRAIMVYNTLFMSFRDLSVFYSTAYGS